MFQFLRKPLYVILVLITVNLLLAAVYIFNFNEKNIDRNMPELSELTGQEDFNELRNYFINLAEERGGAYAFEVLKRAKVAPGTDMHLMGHVVGEILYKQEGAKGMEYCTHDFRNACSHTIVVGLFSEKGIAALPEIAKACQEAPGGKGAYNMCFHGLGHGVLSFMGYDLEKAVGICSDIEKRREDGNEFPECVGGTIMEIISGGDHDKAVWSEKNKEYMSSDDPLYPCNADFIPENSKGMCYTYLTPHLFLYAGGDLGNPTEETFEKAFTYCNRLPEDDPNRKICYGGFGKEFVVLARARDIREVDKITDEELGTIEKWCRLAENKDGITACETTALDSIFWGGENDRNAAIRFCGIISDEAGKELCFAHLVRIVNYYIDDPAYKDDFCREIPSGYSSMCESII